MPLNKASNLLFIHIPKNGGKVIEDSFYMSARPGKAANQNKRSLISKITKNTFSVLNNKNVTGLRGEIDVRIVAQHLTLSEIYFLNLVEDLNSIDIFTVVRNPYERLISLYCHHVKSVKWSNSDLEHFACYWPKFRNSGTRHNVLAHKRTQQEFVDNHFCKECKINVYKLEEVNVNDIAQRYSCSIRPKSTYLKSKFEDAIGNRSKEEIEKKKKLRLSRRAIQSILDYYESDFEAFNYSKEYLEE